MNRKAYLRHLERALKEARRESKALDEKKRDLRAKIKGLRVPSLTR